MTEETTSAPHARGQRAAWESLPAPILDALQTALGDEIVDAITMPGGFSPGIAARVRTANEHLVAIRIFAVLVAEEDRNPAEICAWHRCAGCGLARVGIHIDASPSVTVGPPPHTGRSVRGRSRAHHMAIHHGHQGNCPAGGP